MRNFLSLALCLMLITTLICGCGSGGGTSGSNQGNGFTVNLLPSKGSNDTMPQGFPPGTSLFLVQIYSSAGSREAQATIVYPNTSCTFTGLTLGIKVIRVAALDNNAQLLAYGQGNANVASGSTTTTDTNANASITVYSGPPAWAVVMPQSEYNQTYYDQEQRSGCVALVTSPTGNFTRYEYTVTFPDGQGLPLPDQGAGGEITALNYSYGPVTDYHYEGYAQFGGRGTGSYLQAASSLPANQLAGTYHFALGDQSQDIVYEHTYQPIPLITTPSAYSRADFSRPFLVQWQDLGPDYVYNIELSHQNGNLKDYYWSYADIRGFNPNNWQMLNSFLDNYTTRNFCLIPGGMIPADLSNVTISVRAFRRDWVQLDYYTNQENPFMTVGKVVIPNSSHQIMLNPMANLQQSPYLSGLTPDNGARGTQVTLTGGRFGASQGDNYRVFFGPSQAGTAVSWSDTQIVVTVPNDALNCPVYVQVNEMISNPREFIVNGPYLSSITPNNVPVGTLVTLMGEKFGEAQGSSRVVFSGVNAANALSWADNLIVIAVPFGAHSGDVKVYVNDLPSHPFAFNIVEN